MRLFWDQVQWNNFISSKLTASRLILSDLTPPYFESVLKMYADYGIIWHDLYVA